MSIFASLKIYPDKWTVKDTVEFTAEEIAAVSSASIERGDFSYALCINFVAGGRSYIPLSPKSNLVPGDKVDIRNINIIILEKKGEKDIFRAEEKGL